MSGSRDGQTSWRVRITRPGRFNPGRKDHRAVRRTCDPALRARAGGGFGLRPVWTVRATVGQVDEGKALLRKAAARTIEDLWDAVAAILHAFTPDECINYFVAVGYDLD